MKISRNWLADYITIDLPIEELSELLTNTGLEVEGIEEVESIQGGLKGLVIGEVLSKEKHENADKLSVCQVNIGEEVNQIVCGAPNVEAGQKVVVATVGSTLYPNEGEPFQIKKAKIRGVESFGMICAEDEIGLGDSHEGIMVLPAEAKVGTSASDYFGVEADTVIEIGLTPNRADANSHIGTARDVAVALSVQNEQEIPVNWPSTSNFQIDEQSMNIDVQVEATDACPRYAGILIKDIEIKDSPDWLKNRLKAIGVNPINNVVDITNFINHEYGQPLHAFDYEQIEGQKIIVKTLPENTVFKTLDEVERKLSSNDLMICNANSPMCIAGVYGGIDSGVTEKTTSIFLECAYFSPTSIRKTLVHHQLRTDAAMKFEKGIDPTKQIEVLKRSAMLIKELAGATIASDIIDVVAKPIEAEQVTLTMRKLNSLTGVDFSQAEAKRILELLDFEIVNETEGRFELSVPLYRSDVYREADVIEEVLRIYGFYNVPLSGKTSFSLTYITNEMDALKDKLAEHLKGKGYQEIMTNSITQSKYYQNTSFKQEEFVKPLNSLNQHLDILRPEMLHTGLEVIAHNINHSNGNCLFFEFGKQYRKKDNYQEVNRLALFTTGGEEENWLGANSYDYFHIKQVTDEVLSKANAETLKQQESNNEFLAEGIQFLQGEQLLAEIGEVDSKVLQKMGVKQRVFFTSIDLDRLLKIQLKAKTKYQPISKFPTIQRDLALVINKSVSYAEIEQIATNQKIKDLANIDLFDVFEDEEKLGANKKSYALRFTFKNAQKTLTNKQVDKLMSRLISGFESELKAVIRS